MAQPRNPAHGARYLFARTHAAGGEAEYSVTLRVAERDVTWTLLLTSDGEPAVAGTEPSDVDPALQRDALILSRQLVRAYTKEGVWPRKLSRWRG